MNENSATSNYPSQEWIESVRQQMLAFAFNQLNDHHLAEDAVQESLMAALQHRDQFKGQASFKSWVFAILKNKMVDYMRKNSKYTALSDLSSTQDNEDHLLDTLFDQSGHWHKDSIPHAFNQSWCNPEAHVHADSFWQVLETCLTHLPSEQARAFLMREYLELATDDICQQLAISHSHYYVLMHRAKLRLQTCLSLRWFDETATAS